MSRVIINGVEDVLAVVSITTGGTTPPPTTEPPPTTTPPTEPPPTTTPPAGYTIKDVEIPWHNPTRQYTKDHGGFGPSDIFAYSFVTGTAYSDPNNLPKLSGAEYGAGAVTRVWALSDTRGNFAPLGGCFYASGKSQAVTAPFSVGVDPYPGMYPSLKPNTRYYLNVKLAPPEEIGSVNDAAMFMDLSSLGLP